MVGSHNVLSEMLILDTDWLGTLDYPPLEIGFNVSYLLNVLNTMDGTQARLELGDSNSSALITDPEHEAAIYVVMPMRL